jgi:hypothetical protein
MTQHSAHFPGTLTSHPQVISIRDGTNQHTVEQRQLLAKSKHHLSPKHHGFSGASYPRQERLLLKTLKYNRNNPLTPSRVLHSARVQKPLRPQLVSLEITSSMAPRIEVIPRPNNLRFYSALKSITFTVVPPPTGPRSRSEGSSGRLEKGKGSDDNSKKDNDTEVTLLELFLVRAPAKRILQTEVLLKKKGLEMTATEVIGGHWGAVLRLQMNKEEYKEGEKVKEKPRVRIKRRIRRKGEDKEENKRRESEKGMIWYDTNGYEVREEEVRLEGEGRIENDSWEVMEIGAEGWFRVEWDVGRWRDKSKDEVEEEEPEKECTKKRRRVK